MPSHDVLKDFEDAEKKRSDSLQRLGIKRHESIADGALNAMASLLDRIESLERAVGKKVVK